MRLNPIARSRSLEGGILVYHRESNDTWIVMWRTSEGRKYKSFKQLGQANFFAAELQQDRRRNGAKPQPSVLSPADARLWQELRQLTKSAPLSELIQAWKERQQMVSANGVRPYPGLGCN